VCDAHCGGSPCNIGCSLCDPACPGAVCNVFCDPDGHLCSPECGGDPCNRGCPDLCDPQLCPNSAACDPSCGGDPCAEGCDVGLDCNRNHVNDSCDVQLAAGTDQNANGFPDECETLAAFQDCMSGPGVHTAPRNPLHDAALCRSAFDNDGNSQVDMLDWMAFIAAAEK
jgi:hypothetical protein